ncbi:MAG: hypothetical protein HYX48_03725 [Chlamydiales bacterium]|nr:hypothetical protein [Chlamydiales bacterium]
MKQNKLNENLWRREGLKKGQDGVIVGCTHRQEWILPWWWMHYHFYNSLPVTFVDFGMSEKAKNWCKKRGELVALEATDSLILPKEKVDPKLATAWETLYPDFWQHRPGWFSKPFAFLKTPYERTIWVDLDCQVRTSLSELFDKCENPAMIALARDPYQYEGRKEAFALPDEITFNSGFVVYKHGSPIITQWAEWTATRNAEFFGDQNILSRALHEKKLAFQELPITYNWLLVLGDKAAARIRHFGGPQGKAQIKEEINALNDLFLFNLTL